VKAPFAADFATCANVSGFMPNATISSRASEMAILPRGEGEEEFLPPTAKPIKALAVADKLHCCSRSANFWTADNMHSKTTGDLFDGVGTLWNCNERLCPSCLATRARRTRVRARAAIDRPKIRNNQRWRFITLTMPTRPAAESSLLNTLHVISRAWRLFSKREWWRKTVQAGVKGVEFTMGNPHGDTWDPERHGYHVHMHLLVLSTWVEWRRLRTEWSECLQEAWSEFGITQGINTKDGLAVCDVRLVVNRKARRSDGVISGEGAINEVAKYLTKSESWEHVPESQLVEVASLAPWPRMFELLGECRSAGRPGSEPTKSKDVSAPSREEKHNGEFSLEERLHILLWDDGSPAAINLWIKAMGEKKSEELEISKETRDEIYHSTAYLDTPNLSGGKNPRDGPIWKRNRGGQMLREIGAKLIAAGARTIWKEMLAAKAELGRSFRRSWQVREYPFARFRSLDGKSWWGLRANPASSS